MRLPFFYPLFCAPGKIKSLRNVSYFVPNNYHSFIVPSLPHNTIPVAEHVPDLPHPTEKPFSISKPDSPRSASQTLISEKRASVSPSSDALFRGGFRRNAEDPSLSIQRASADFLRGEMDDLSTEKGTAWKIKSGK